MDAVLQICVFTEVSISISSLCATPDPLRDHLSSQPPHHRHPSESDLLLPHPTDHPGANSGDLLVAAMDLELPVCSPLGASLRACSSSVDLCAQLINPNFPTPRSFGYGIKSSNGSREVRWRSFGRRGKTRFGIEVDPQVSPRPLPHHPRPHPGITQVCTQAIRSPALAPGSDDIAPRSEDPGGAYSGSSAANSNRSWGRHLHRHLVEQARLVQIGCGLMHCREDGGFRFLHRSC